MLSILEITSRFLSGDFILWTFPAILSGIVASPLMFIRRKWTRIIVFTFVFLILLVLSHYLAEAIHTWWVAPLGPPLFPLGTSG